MDSVGLKRIMIVLNAGLNVHLGFKVLQHSRTLSGPSNLKGDNAQVLIVVLLVYAFLLNVIPK